MVGCVSATGRCDGRQSGDLKIFRLQTQMSGIRRAIMRPHWQDRAISGRSTAENERPLANKPLSLDDLPLLGKKRGIDRSD